MRGMPARPGRGVAQEVENVFPLPRVGRGAPGQGCVPVGAGRGEGGQDVHAPAFGVLVGDDRAHAGRGPGVGGGQGGAEAGLV